MTKEVEGKRYQRGHVAAFLVPVILFQIYVAFAAYRNAEMLRDLITNAGVEAPVITLWFLNLYKAFPVVPVVSILAGVDLLRRDHPSIWHTSMVLFTSFLVAFVMQAWANEAWFLPLFQLIKAMG